MASWGALRADQQRNLAGGVRVEDSDGAAARDDGDEILAATPRDRGEAQTSRAAARGGERTTDLCRVETLHEEEEGEVESESEVGWRGGGIDWFGLEMES